MDEKDEKFLCPRCGSDIGPEERVASHGGFAFLSFPMHGAAECMEARVERLERLVIGVAQAEGER